MKKFLAIAFALAISGAAYAGCGVKVPVDGKISAYDAEKKAITVGKETITLAANATVTDAEGKAVKIDALVGKDVKISTDKHTKKAESVKAAKS
jgi:ribosomal protein L18E